MQHVAYVGQAQGAHQDIVETSQNHDDSRAMTAYVDGRGAQRQFITMLGSSRDNIGGDETVSQTEKLGGVPECICIRGLAVEPSHDREGRRTGPCTLYGIS